MILGWGHRYSSQKKNTGWANCGAQKAATFQKPLNICFPIRRATMMNAADAIKYFLSRPR